jgi:tetratricopeptide (TPR) repeat protein
MRRRYLFGPVTAGFADQQLHRARQSGDCLAFGPEGADLAVASGDSWEAICARLPAGWQPDFVALNLAYTCVPAGLWAAPVPLVGLATDWDLLWHACRRQARGCDLLLTDAPGVEALAREGVTQARAANLAGCPRGFVEEPWPDGPRDLDVLFAGNLSPAVQRERLPWLARVARLARDRRVALHMGVFGDAYRQLLGRARIVFNRSRHGECNRRVAEAVAAGALLFQEADNREVPALLRDRQECVFYTAENLESLLEHYLEHEDERRALTLAARARVARFAFEALWDGLLDQIEQEWPRLAAAAGHRPPSGGDDLLTRCWQALSGPSDGDPDLVAALQAVVQDDPRSAALHNALGLAVARAGLGQGREVVEGAARHFRRAVECDPHHLPATLNLAEALAAAGQTPQAVAQAQRALAVLDAGTELSVAQLDAGHFPPVFDLFRVEWERAAWQHAGQPAAEARAKGRLLRWRLHSLLAQWTGDLAHAYEAVLARPELPFTRAALGTTLARAGRPRQAVVHLRQALAGNPFQREAAHALFDALGAAGDADGQRLLAEDRRLLARAAPQAVPPEPWFAEGAPATAAVPAERFAAAPPHLEGALGPTVAPAGAMVSLIPSAPRARRARVTLSMIVKNEEANLPVCLGSVADLMDEVIVVDTGSADRTREVAARFGARVHEFPWCDDFGAARNEGLRHATGDWVLWLDADDCLDEDNRQRLRAVFTRLGGEMDAYAMKVRSALDPAQSAAKLLDQVRLFPRHPEVRWRYRVHEQIMPAVNLRGGSVRWTDVIIDHRGYQDAALRRRKLERNLRLLHLDEKDHPEDAYVLFNLGWSYQDLGRHAEALPLLRRSLERAKPQASIVRKLYVLLTEGQRALGRRDEALAVCRAGRERFADDAELLYLEAGLRHDGGDVRGTEECLLRLLAMPAGTYFASLDVGLRGYKTRHQLAGLYQQQGRTVEAEAQWRAVLAERPDFVPAWLGLGELYLAAGRWADLDQVAHGLEAQTVAALDGAILRARAHLLRREFAEARRLVEQILAQAPQGLGPRVLLSHVLLQEGRDWAAVEQALQAVLALDPNNAEARHNLEVLRHRQAQGSTGK